MSPSPQAVPRGGPWDATASHWLGTIICGVEPERNSLRDYIDTGLDGENPQVAEGLGTLVARLAEGLPVRLQTPVRRIRCDGAVTVEGPRGAVRARGCIVTVSTGVLAAGGIGFEPGLPAGVQEAIHGLPLALLSKVALRGGEGLGLGPFARLGRRVEGPGDRPMSWMLHPFGRDHAIGFTGGEAAWALAREGPAAAEAFARAELARYFGAAAVAGAFRQPAVVTDWGENPLFLGAYSYARVGAAGARAVLAGAALADGRLRFAGEAATPAMPARSAAPGPAAPPRRRRSMRRSADAAPASVQTAAMPQPARQDFAAHASACRDRVVAMTRALVAVPSPNPPRRYPRLRRGRRQADPGRGAGRRWNCTRPRASSPIWWHGCGAMRRGGGWCSTAISTPIR